MQIEFEAKILEINVDEVIAKLDKLGVKKMVKYNKNIDCKYLFLMK